MNGVTGRMGTNQHLMRSIVAIRREGGVALRNGERLMPDPILVGRDEGKLARLAEAGGVERWSTDLDSCLRNVEDTIYFDAQTTGLRADSVRRALYAGKHVYCEKPLSTDSASALELAREASSLGLKHGVVQDKLFLPGLRKLKRLIDGGFFGRILSVRGEFGYWVFEGDWQPAQRPSWNYRKEDGGGIIADMFCHWQYVLENLFGPVKAVSCLGAIHISERVDEQGNRYRCTADDAAYGTFELENGIIAQMNSSWDVRVYRDDLFVLQVDGTEGSAVADLRSCRTQHRANTPKPVWNPDVPNPISFREGWAEVPDNEVFDNGFKVQWERFLRHVTEDAPFPYTFWQGVRGVQLAEAGLRSWQERRWVEMPVTVEQPEKVLVK
jgi:predicted dehydrogenase